MPARLALFALTLAALGLAACTSAPRPPGPSAGDCRVIGVSSNGWHAGVYLPAELFDEAGPLRRAFPAAHHFAIGWGDAAAYPGPLGPINGTAAILWPTPSVLHIAALPRDPRTAYRQTYRNVALSEAGLAALIARLEAEFALSETGDLVFTEPGLDPRGSAFFKARSRYHAFNTCNVWLAARLGEAGVPAGWSGGHLLPSSLMRQLGRAAPSACPEA